MADFTSWILKLNVESNPARSVSKVWRVCHGPHHRSSCFHYVVPAPRTVPQLFLVLGLSLSGGDQSMLMLASLRNEFFWKRDWRQKVNRLLRQIGACGELYFYVQMMQQDNGSPYSLIFTTYIQYPWLLDTSEPKCNLSTQLTLYSRPLCLLQDFATGGPADHWCSDGNNSDSTLRTDKVLLATPPLANG